MTSRLLPSNRATGRFGSLNAALATAGLPDWRYQLLPVPPELFAEVLAGLPGAGFRGANVTIPHKEAALALATRPSQRAAAIGAANTLIFAGDNDVLAASTGTEKRPDEVDAVANPSTVYLQCFR